MVEEDERYADPALSQDRGRRGRVGGFLRPADGAAPLPEDPPAREGQQRGLLLVRRRPGGGPPGTRSGPPAGPCQRRRGRGGRWRCRIGRRPPAPISAPCRTTLSGSSLMPTPRRATS